jgi:hypothetical protein
LMKERGGDTGIDALGSPLAVGSELALIATRTAHLRRQVKIEKDPVKPRGGGIA